ncbi:MAG: HlyD family efflux transporter periplasmic adaptor subunit, partial [Deinococcales bacterium]
MVHASAPRRRARRRRWIWISAGVAVVAVAAVFVVMRPRGPAPQRVYLESVRREAFVREVSGTGTVEPARSRLLVFPSAGTVTEVRVTEGQRVAAGAELARLDTRTLARDLASTRSSLDSARADLQRVTAQQAIDRLDAEAAVTAAENRLADLRQTLADARTHLAATEQLYTAGGASLNERDAARTAVEQAQRQEREAELALRTARARLQSFDALAEAQRRSGEANVQRLETTLANTEQQLAEGTLRAPFEGVVSSVPFKVGDSVSPTGRQGIELVDDATVSVQADFDENRSVDLAPGQRATITPDAAPDLALPAVVTRVDPVAARGDGTARLRAEIAFAPDAGEPVPRAAIRPGYTVTAKVVVHRIPDALVLPLESIESANGMSYVYRVRQSGTSRSLARGVAQRVEVEVLDRNATLAAVADGTLDEGDRVAATN